MPPGIVRVLVTVDVVSEGFDVPAASCAILLRPTQSLGLYLQQVGRVLRPAPGNPLR
jgi:DNA repair protein RadD